MFNLFVEEMMETTGYMIAGYAVIFGLMALYILSLVLRRRALERDYQTLVEIVNEESEKVTG